MRYAIGAMTALLFSGVLIGQSSASDLLSGNEANIAQLSLANLTNTIASSPVTIGTASIDGGSIGLTTGDISGLSQENTGGINVMMVNTGTLSNQQSVVTTSTTIGGVPVIQELVSGAN